MMRIEHILSIPSDKEKKIVLDCSPYMYLQILYLYAGAPNAKNETLITIDMVLFHEQICKMMEQTGGKED